MSMETEFRILGPIQVLRDGEPIPLGSHKQRAVLAILLLHPNEVVSTGRLIDDLWGEEPPAGDLKTLRSYVSRLRTALGKDGDREALLSRSPGYTVVIDEDGLDSAFFERLARVGHEALVRRDAASAAHTLHEALSLWRGPALSDFAYEPFAQAEIVRLEELRLAVTENRMEAELALGRHQQLVSELEWLIGTHPFREGLRAQLMLALYRSGRQAEALAAYRQARDVLVEELGIEPGSELRGLESAILRQDPSLALPAPGAAVSIPAPAPPEVESRPTLTPAESRKTVTVMFCDLADSTGLAERLDPEALRQVLDRYFEVAAEVVRRHGGTTEKFIGDAVMACFGVPSLHEDDAFRAVRAAVELRERLARLNEELGRDRDIRLEARIGINTGEVLAREASSGQALVTGDAVTTAARLQQAADPGEILLADTTYRLVEGAVRAELLAPLELKGKREPVAALRVLELVPGAPAFRRRLDAPLVGREGELAQLRAAFDRIIREETSYLFTILGEAGIGKTRLAQEFCSTLEEEAQVLAGRCLPYGEGITFWPLREVIQGAFGVNSHGRIVALLEGQSNPELMADRLAAAIGLGKAPGAREEIFRAARKVLEALGRTEPLVVVLEDIHWAEPTFLDLVEHVADYSTGAPILLLCVARPELLEEHASWGGGKRNATSIHLEPLRHDECELLLGNLAGALGLTPEVRARVTDIADGNPLFIEQTVAMLIEKEAFEGAVPLPPTIQALLATRLERLGPGELAVLQRAAVIGKEFPQGAVTELLLPDGRSTVPRHLQELIRKGFIRPERSSLPGEEGFRFRHVLIQDAAYRTIPKSVRAELHERFGTWVEQEAETREAEYDEIIGYHLEQAYRYRSEIGPVGAQVRDLARQAAERLASAAQRAIDRGDEPAAVDLLSRATSLLPAELPARLKLLTDLGDALREKGDFEDAENVLAEAIEAAAEAGDARIEARALVARAELRFSTDASNITQPNWEAERAISVLEEAGDDVGLARAWRLIASLRWRRGHVGLAKEARSRSVEHARQAGARREEFEGRVWLTKVDVWGPAPVAEATARCEEILQLVAGDMKAEAFALGWLGLLRAITGRFLEARQLTAQTQAILRDLGLELWAAWEKGNSAWVEILSGDAAAAERELHQGYDTLVRIGDEDRAQLAAMLGQACYLQGRYEEAEHFALSSLKINTNDIARVALARGVCAKVHARLSRLAEGERMAREAVALLEATDLLISRADALMDLVEVLRLAGRPDEAGPVVEEALRLSERKGNIVAVEKARALQAELAAESAHLS